MHSKKMNLQINTQMRANNYNHQLEHQHKVPFNRQQQYQEKFTAAVILERLLSSNLAEKFISCWNKLRQLVQVYNQLPNIHQRNNKNLQSHNVGYSYPQGYNQIQMINSREYIPNKSRYQSEFFREKKILRTQSVESSSKLELSRAQILQRIAQKLKDNQNNYNLANEEGQIFWKLNRLEKLMKDIQCSQIAHSKDIIISTNNDNHSKHNEDMQLLMNQLHQLKGQIKTIKKYNEQIIKNEISKQKELFRHKRQEEQFSSKKVTNHIDMHIDKRQRIKSQSNESSLLLRLQIPSQHHININSYSQTKTPQNKKYHQPYHHHYQYQPSGNIQYQVPIIHRPPIMLPPKIIQGNRINIPTSTRNVTSSTNYTVRTHNNSRERIKSIYCDYCGRGCCCQDLRRK